MKIKLTAIFLTFIVNTFSFSQSGHKNFIDQPYIEVTGKIETEIVPDEIYINISIDENDKKGKISIEQQENQMIAILKSLGLDLDNNFSILDFNGYFNRKFLGTDEVIKAKRYELIVNNGETLGKVYEALDRIDISNISIIKTSHSNIENIIREAKLKALKTAKEKADDYAQVINQTIGKALFIQEITSPLNHTKYANTILNEVSITGYGTEYKKEKFQDLNLKNITVSAQVLARFSLQ